MSRINEAVSFDDVLLVPRYSEIVSRSEIEVKQCLKNVGNFSLPVISSPMDTITGVDMAISMHKAGSLGVVHRYNTIKEQVDMVLNIGGEGAVAGAAIGVNGDLIDRAQALVKDGSVSLLCIDVAHGHHSSVRYALETLRKTFGDNIHIMAGNVATRQAFDDLADWGADSIRVGIGGGSICSTRVQTGHGVPTFQSVLDCAMSDRDTTLIADGGIRNSGDMVKALAAGADFVMVGSLLAGTDEAPGEVFNVGGHRGEQRKVYRGMASKEAQSAWRGRVSSIEGISHSVPCRGLVKEVLHDLGVGIRSGLSYSGARSVPELQAKAQFIRQTSAGAIESSTHIKERFR
jgi:IMP dehydrogenase